jgi:5-methylcytosine-specific restriction endonuclease McrA
VTKEAQKIRSRRCYLANREKALARAKRQREENHDEYLAYLKAYSAAIDPAIRKAKSAEYHAANRQRNLASMKAYRDGDKEAAKRRDAAKYQKRKPIALAQSAEKYASDPAVVKARVRAWKKANPETAAAIRRNYKARKRAASGSHTGEDIQRLFMSQNMQCAICQCELNNKWHVDHIMPLRLGGSNDAGNLQLLCVRCNTSKGGKHPADYARHIEIRVSGGGTQPEL